MKLDETFESTFEDVVIHQAISGTAGSPIRLVEPRTNIRTIQFKWELDLDLKSYGVRFFTPTVLAVPLFVLPVRVNEYDTKGNVKVVVDEDELVVNLAVAKHRFRRDWNEDSPHGIWPDVLEFAVDLNEGGTPKTISNVEITWRT